MSPAMKLTIKSAREGYVVITMADREIALQEDDTLTISGNTYSITYREDQ